jgi:hypothetical protein
MPQPKPKSSKVRHKLSNGYLEALRDFGEGETIVRWDTDVRQLRVIVGPRKTSFSFFQQHRRYGGKLGTTAVTLGEFPAMSVTQAHKGEASARRERRKRMGLSGSHRRIAHYEL